MASLHCLSASCFAVPNKPQSFAVSHRSSVKCCSLLRFSSNLSSVSAFPKASLFWMDTVEKSKPLRTSVVCDAAAPTRKADSAEKRARQSEKRRIYNKSKKSEMKTKMKKVIEALDVLQKKTEAMVEEVVPIEKLIGEAYSAIDKAVKCGTLHKNTGANRKSRLARRKKAVEIHHGWYSLPSSSQSVITA
ncbi:30S ribosomal protein S20, chloroplastic [Zostera marina]|uniref:Small ribosomal subunit protein bS20c n=1 Tax=Zostera marina TaxID=29655 RepID=A0A0K9Q480_ZOSMR|nr:30S ribosomal protein S20, chloroplastic [Zostera marina]